MPTIQVMSATLASQVAAGEVVERPASVVKELVENSLDAGAKTIRIEIRRGGVGLIKVVDDGCGMSREDLELCTQRHATSKLSSINDLFEITHLGFRGEAIPSIASVSKFRISSRQTNSLDGWELLVEGGQEHPVRSSGISPGTSIEVSELFYNTPARRKFLKSPETEASHIEHQIRLHALAFPQVRFIYRRDDQQIFDLPGTTDLRVRISALTDVSTTDALIPIEPTIGPGITVQGFLLPVTEARRSKKAQFIFLNNRPVEDQLITRSIRDGYGGFPTGFHPALYLYLDVEPALVDVNVHPAKKEVRFRRPVDIVNTIVDAIANTLQNKTRQIDSSQPAPLHLPPQEADHSIDVVPEPSVQPPSVSNTTEGPRPIVFPSSVTKKQNSPAPSEKPFVLKPITIKQVPATQTHLPLGKSEFAAGSAIHSSSVPPSTNIDSNTQKLDGFHFLAMLPPYALFEAKEGLVLMSLQAARERIIFEQLRNHKHTPIPSQQLLDPIVVDLDPRDFDIILKFSEHFDQAGMTITPFGQNTIRLESIPAMLDLSNTKTFLMDLIDKFTHSEYSRAAKTLAYDEFIKVIAKNSAQKENTSSLQPVPILKDLLLCEVPYCTPSGKPTLINYSFSEIKRKFGASN